MDETFGRIVSILLIAAVLAFGKVVWVWSVESGSIDRKGCRLSTDGEVYYLRNGRWVYPGDYVRDGWTDRAYRNGERIF